MGEAAAWAEGFEVVPRFRMSGVFHKHWVVALEMLRERGIERVYGAMQSDSPASVKAHRGVGFDFLYRLRVFRLAGLVFHKAVPIDDPGLPGSRRIGRWVGEDRSRPDLNEESR
jgi:hypothetical protein